jgi:hypothetical protein
MKRLHWLALFLVALLAAGCAGALPADEEKQTQMEEFPASRFLTAEAVGETEGGAKRAALAELAAVFESRVHAQTVQRATSWVEDGLPEQFDKQVEQSVRVDTRVQLKGARIGRVVPDEAGGGFRALAVLDKRRAAGRWDRELEQVQMALDGQTAALTTIRGRLSRLGALNRISALMVREAVIQSRLSVLGRPAMEEPADRSSLIAEREKLAREASLFIQLEGNPAPPFARRLNALLAADGYRLTPYRDEAAGLITGMVTVQPLNLGNPEVRFIRALADIQLVDLDTDAQLAAFDEAVRKGHADEGEAARRAVNGAAAQVAANLAGALGTLGIATDE